MAAGEDDAIVYICMAYEQGHGKGLRKSKLTNPYNIKQDEYVAWEYGKSEGLNKYKKRNKDECNRV